MLAPGGPLALSGMFDQTVLESGNNVLVYTSEPLSQPMHVFGAPWHRGLCLNLGIVRGSHRKAHSRRCPSRRVLLYRHRAFNLPLRRQYQADQIHRWEFDLEPTSYVFAIGDRVRLEIAASAFPLYDRNPSTNIKPSEMSQWNWQRSTHMIHHDAENLSALHLPVVS